MNYNMNKYIVKLALETLLEQLVDSRENSEDNKAKIEQVQQEINNIKNIKL